MHVILLFTYGYSLKLWHDSGALEREIIYYKKLTNEGEKITIDGLEVTVLEIDGRRIESVVVKKIAKK